MTSLRQAYINSPCSIVSSPPPSVPAASDTPLLLLNVITKQNVLIAQVQFAVGDDGMLPGGGTLAVGLVESVANHTLLGIGFQQDHGVLFLTIVQPIVGVGDGAFAGVIGGPHELARLEFDAGQVVAIGAVQVVVHQDHAAVMVLHVLGGIDNFGLAFRRNLGQSGAGAVVGRGEYERSADNGRGAIGGAVGRLVIAPEEFAVLGGHADNALTQELNVLPLAIQVGGHDGRISGAIAFRNGALPN